MKICKKCENKYKEEYIYCPKCGKPHNPNTKYAKIPGELSQELKDLLKNILNIILYAFGFMIIGISLLDFKEAVVFNVMCIILGISLFPIVYNIIEEKMKITKKDLLILIRILIPIFILFVLSMSV